MPKNILLSVEFFTRLNEDIKMLSNAPCLYQFFPIQASILNVPVSCIGHQKEIENHLVLSKKGHCLCHYSKNLLIYFCF